MQKRIPTIPAVDIAPLFGTDSAAIAAVDQAIGKACEEAGAFLAIGIPKPVCPDSSQTKKLLAFYELPIEVRQSLGTRRINPASSRDYRGYYASLKGGWAHNEMYDIGPAYEVTVPDLPYAEQLIESNAWPPYEPTDGWQQEMETYYNHMHDFSEKLMRSMLRYLGANEEVGAARFENSNSTLRLLNYPELPDGLIIGEQENATREFGGEQLRVMAIEHKDQCCLSLLWQSDVGGLQMQAPSGEWQAIPEEADAISIHLGMSMERMSGDVFAATPHRVLGKGNTARQSIGFFFEPNPHGSTLPFTREAQEPPTPIEETYAGQLLQTFAERQAKREAQEAAS
ncbi:MAG: 2OG-Fe(II) oxygenase family protein [Chloroflexota bacterium]